MGEGKMPAIKIQTAATQPGQNDFDRPHLRLSWGHDCAYVQVASLFDPKHGADVIIQTVNEWLKAAGLNEVPGREELDKLITERAEPDSIAAQMGIGFEGFHVSLDYRSSVNELIAAARKSRDQAFGRDE
jgi:hypothetical protein